MFDFYQKVSSVFLDSIIFIDLQPDSGRSQSLRTKEIFTRQPCRRRKARHAGRGRGPMDAARPVGVEAVPLSGPRSETLSLVFDERFF